MIDLLTTRHDLGASFIMPLLLLVTCLYLNGSHLLLKLPLLCKYPKRIVAISPFEFLIRNASSKNR